MRNVFIFIAFFVDKPRAYKDIMAPKINNNISTMPKKTMMLQSLSRPNPHNI
jgi:hypothetical protein